MSSVILALLSTIGSVYGLFSKFEWFEEKLADYGKSSVSFRWEFAVLLEGFVFVVLLEGFVFVVLLEGFVFVVLLEGFVFVVLLEGFVFVVFMVDGITVPVFAQTWVKI